MSERELTDEERKLVEDLSRRVERLERCRLIVDWRTGSATVTRWPKTVSARSWT